MLISVHLPKTGGESFRESLKQHFGPALCLDYDDFPINTPVLRRNTHALLEGIKNRFRPFDQNLCIHGHFLPLKYLFLPRQLNARYITWMRDPIERLASHYYFWKRTPDVENQPVKRRMLDENWSFERFALGPEHRNVYCQMFWGFPLKKLDFIGITEHYEEDFKYFCNHFWGIILEEKRVNVNQEQGNRPYITDINLRKRIEEYHWADVAIYRNACKARDIRMRETPPTHSWILS